MATLAGRQLPFLLIALYALAPDVVYGLGAAIPNQDAEAIGRGNAFIASASNPSAIYYNPAAITQLDGIQAQFGAHNLAVNSRCAPKPNIPKARFLLLDIMKNQKSFILMNGMHS